MAERLGGFVVPLTALRRGDAPVAGGKGANLGELIRAGAPVPAGFVLTCAAYDAHLHHNGLAGRLTELLAAAPDGSQLREAVTDAPVPDSVVEQLQAEYALLVGDPTTGAVAVRSSASAEDLPTAAMAGQHETRLNVVGTPALIDAVRECWASLWTQRAIDYRQRHGITNEEMAVVVQRMVPAETAGVMFTAHPVTGARDEIVVDATPGLGEAMLSGLVTPEHIVLDKRSGRLRSPKRSKLLAPPHLARLARLARRVERHFGAPQDIEWAWYRSRAYLLQARPITALPRPPPRSGYGRMLSALVAEVLPMRPYPMDVTTWLGGLLTAAGQVAHDLGLGSHPLGEMVVTDGVVVDMHPPTLRPNWRLLTLPGRLGRWARQEPIDDAALREAMVAPVRHLADRDPAAASWPELVATLRAASALPPELIAYRLRGLSDVMSLLWLGIVLWLTGRLDLLGSLLSGTENKTAETGRALDDLAARIRANAELARLFTDHPPTDLLPRLAEAQPAFLAEFHDFLDRYGHRETTSPLLATQPTWRDAPEVVLGLLRARSATPAAPVPEQLAWQTARTELLGHHLLRPAPVRRRVDCWLTAARQAFQARENGRFYLTLALPVVHGVIRELGQRLHNVGALDRPDDVFHLTLDELAQVRAWPPPAATVADFRARVARRAARRAALADTLLTTPAHFGGPRFGAPFQEVLLRGAPGSPGLATGPARIIHDASEFHRLRPGEVLVTPYTNPAWTPLFPQAAAVVVDTGGVMSHAAVVAREYRIPAVMATGDGTRRLTDGQRVQVDGAHGLVQPA